MQCEKQGAQGRARARRDQFVAVEHKEMYMQEKEAEKAALVDYLAKTFGP